MGAPALACPGCLRESGPEQRVPALRELVVWGQMGEQSAGKGYGLMVRKELQTASPRGSQEWQVPCWRSPVGLRPGPCCGHTARLDRTKGCRLFMELGLTPGAASGPGRRPAHLAAGCPPPAQPPHPTSRPGTSPPRDPALLAPSLWSQRWSWPRPWPSSCGWKVLLRICSQRVSYETRLECPSLPHSPPAASLFPSVCLLPFVSAVTL